MPLLDGVRHAAERVRAGGYRILDTVPPLRRLVEELVRLELIDRCMVIAAQALMALVPLLVVASSVLPDDATTVALDRVSDVIGLSSASDLVAGDLDRGEVQAQTGLVGALIILFSATSFARAVQRMYEKVWELDHVGGMIGRRRCFTWLVAWLVALQALTLFGWVADRIDGWDVVLDVGRTLASSAIWWGTMRALVFGRVPGRSLVVPGLLTGAAVLLYTSGSAVVMPAYAASSAGQFGTLGLVLALATWLVGLAGVLVVAAVVGRVLVEDAWLRAVWAGVLGRLTARSSGQS